MKSKILDWVVILLTLAFTVAALGVMGGYEQGRLDEAGFFIALAVCITVIVLLAVVHHLLSKKEKALLVREHQRRAKEKLHVKSIADRKDYVKWLWIFLVPTKSMTSSMLIHLGSTKNLARTKAQEGLLNSTIRR